MCALPAPVRPDFRVPLDPNGLEPAARSDREERDALAIDWPLLGQMAVIFKMYLVALDLSAKAARIFAGQN